MGQSLTELDCQILDYCLMSSHVHLVVLAGQHPLSRLIVKTRPPKVSSWMKSALSVHDELEPLVDKVEGPTDLIGDPIHRTSRLSSSIGKTRKKRSAATIRCSSPGRRLEGDSEVTTKRHKLWWPAKRQTGQKSEPEAEFLSGSQPFEVLIGDEEHGVVKPATKVAPRHVPAELAALSYGSI